MACDVSPVAMFGIVVLKIEELAGKKVNLNNPIFKSQQKFE